MGMQPPGKMETGDSRTEVAISLAAQEQEAVVILEQINYMLEESGERWRWAEDTLDGIRETILRTHRVSAAQRRAVVNIEDAGNKE